MKAIINGKIILKDRILEGKTLLYSDKIEGIVDDDTLNYINNILQKYDIEQVTKSR